MAATPQRLIWTVRRVPLDQLRLLELNAHYMDAGKFQRLVANIKEDGQLTSVPLAAPWGVYQEGDTPEHLPDGRPVYEVLSGNHRVSAAKEAGLTEIDVMVSEGPISRAKRRAIQIAHNAIVGEDDPVVLKQLWDSIGDVNLKQYAGLNDKEIAELDKLKLGSLSEPNLEYRELTFLFLPWEVDTLRERLTKAVEECKADHVFLARREDWDRLLDALADAGDANRVENRATALLAILEVFDRHLSDLAEPWEAEENWPKRRWVPLSSVFGTRNVPQDVAVAVKQAIDRMVDRQEVDGRARWQALRKWAECPGGS